MSWLKVLAGAIGGLFNWLGMKENRKEAALDALSKRRKKRPIWGWAAMGLVIVLMVVDVAVNDGRNLGLLLELFTITAVA